jgi:hypothetical protein
VGRGAPGVQVDHVDGGVADRLAEDQLGLVVHQGGQVLGLARVHEAHLDAVLRQGVREQGVGAAVQGGERDDVVAGVGEVQHGVGDRGRPGRGRQRPHAALQRGEAGLEHRLGRVHDPRVDVARHAQCEQVRGVLGVVEDVAGGLVDRYRAGVGGRVGLLLAGVDAEGVGMKGHVAPGWCAAAKVAPDGRRGRRWAWVR